MPLVLLGLIYTSQERAIFPAPAKEMAQIEQSAAQLGANTFQLATPDGEQLMAWHTPTSGTRAVLYFHGNAGWCVPTIPYHKMLREHGWDYLCVAYRGYTGSTGSPSEAGLHTDAMALWTHAIQTLGIPPENLLIHGSSLGGGVAARLATQVDARGLILESTFRSVSHIAAGTYPRWLVDVLLKHPFDTEGRIDGIDEPTLVLHGDADRTIPVENGRWLAEHLPRATYVEAPGHGHNSGLLTQDAGARAALIAMLEGVPIAD
jgi:hypothetical protein